MSLPRVAVLTAINATVLVRLVPHWSTLGRELADPYRWVEQSGSDGASATLALSLLWLASCWLGIGLLTALLGCLPGEVGRVAGVLSQRMLPTLLQRVMVTAAGASIVWSPVSALADTPPPVPAASTSIVLTLPTDLDPAHPSSSQTSPVTPATAPSSQSPPTQLAPTRQPAMRQAPPVQPPQLEKASTLTVKPGDSLWQIAGDRLGPAATPAKIAAAWPRLYAANRSVIGEDPGLLRPGQTLTIPAPTQAQS